MEAVWNGHLGTGCQLHQSTASYDEHSALQAKKKTDDAEFNDIDAGSFWTPNPNANQDLWIPRRRPPVRACFDPELVRGERAQSDTWLSVMYVRKNTVNAVGVQHVIVALVVFGRRQWIDLLQAGTTTERSGQAGWCGGGGIMTVRY